MTDIIQVIGLLFGTLIGQIIIFFVGYTILYLLPHNKDFPALQKFAISYGIGTGFNCLFMFLSVLIGLHSRFSFIPLLILTIFLFIYFKLWKNLKDDIMKIFNLIKHLKLNIIEIGCVLLLIIELIYLLLYWYIYPIHTWDACTIWDAKAKYFFYDGNFDYFIENPHYYPLLVPLNLTYFYSIFFQYHYFAKIIFVSYFFFLIIFVYYSLRFFKLNRSYSLIISTFLALSSSRLHSLYYFAYIAYADLPLTFFYAISTIFLFYYFSTEKQYYLLYSSIFMGLSAWVKNEGLGLLIINVLILVIYHIFLLIKKRINFKIFLKRSLLFFIIGYSIYLPWQLFCIFNNFTSIYTSNIFDIFNIQTTISDIIIILEFFVNMLLNFKDWGIMFFIFWFVSLIILILNIKTLFKEKIFFLVLLWVSHFLLYIFVYITTPYNLIWQLNGSIDRLLLHLTPTCCFLIGILLAQDDRKLVDLKNNCFGKVISYIFISIIFFFLFDLLVLNNAIFHFFIEDLLYPLLNPP